MSMMGLTQTVQDGRNTQGVTPIYRPLLNGETFDISVSSMKMAMEEFKHDGVKIEATSSELTTVDGIAGQPISFYYGLSPRTELFCGYVESVSEDQSASGSGVLKMTLGILGPTKELQNGTPRQWLNHTVPQVVQKIAFSGLLGFHGHEHDYIWPMLVQTDDSDWRIASALTERLGWALFNRFGVLMCYDPIKQFQNSGAYMSLVSSQYAATAFEDYERALVEFSPQEDSDASYRQIGTKVSYLNNGTVQTTTQEGDKYTVFRYLNVTARGPEEAKIWANQRTSLTASWGQQATARVLGNANLFPGMCVDIYTSNPKWYKGQYNGRWLIRAVTHSADRQTFQTQLKLARPSGSTGVSGGVYTPFWQEPSGQLFKAQAVDGNGGNFVDVGKLVEGRPRPTLMLHDGRWRSSWSDPRVGAVL